MNQPRLAVQDAGQPRAVHRMKRLTDRAELCFRADHPPALSQEEVLIEGSSRLRTSEHQNEAASAISVSGVMRGSEQLGPRSSWGGLLSIHMEVIVERGYDIPTRTGVLGQLSASKGRADVNGGS